MKIATRNLLASAALGLGLALPMSVLAAGSYSFFGDAGLVSPGNLSPTAAEMRTDGDDFFGGVSFVVPGVTTFSDIQELSTDYRFASGNCGAGSPRFSIRLTNGTITKNVFVYIGPPPNYNACPPEVWSNTGNLAAPTNLVDTSQFGPPMGNFYQPYAVAQANFGTYTVVSMSLVADGSAQVVEVDNVSIAGNVFHFETKNNCKKFYHDQKKDFDKQQNDDKKAFEDQQKADKAAFNATPHTQAQKKAFEDQQKADKKAFEEDQKADKKAFDEQNKADEKGCDQYS